MDDGFNRDGIESARASAASQTLPPSQEPCALLLEDDAVCADVAMRFCHAMRIRCIHARTVRDAEACLTRHASIRLIMADLVIAGHEGQHDRPVLDWLRGLDSAPARPLAKVIISGYTDMLGTTPVPADLVLRKPWKPAELAAFLRQRAIHEKGTT